MVQTDVAIGTNIIKGKAWDLLGKRCFIKTKFKEDEEDGESREKDDHGM